MSMLTACSSGVSVRVPRGARPGVIRSSMRAGPTRLNAARVIPTSAKGLGSLGLGSQEAHRLHRKVNQTVSTTTRRSDLRVRAAAGDSGSAGNPITVGAHLRWSSLARSCY
eukprot:1124932-Pyramimonas_sp.AAC.1